MPDQPPQEPARRSRAADRRAATTMRGVNTYSSKLSDAQIERGLHRVHVGGDWDTIGRHQFDFLVAQGLKPNHRMLDIGCGAMRGGVHFARYLEPGHYYGTDINERLIRAARRVEIPAAGLVDRMPKRNLAVSARFEVPFDRKFNYALAQSVFSHLPLNHIRLCLFRTAQVMAPGGRFYATYFPIPEDSPYDIEQWQMHVTSAAERDPFHYRISELKWAASVADWDVHVIGDWGHKRGQHIIEFRKRGKFQAGMRRRIRSLPGGKSLVSPPPRPPRTWDTVAPKPSD